MCSDQAWPCLCDWNGDGVTDMVIGGGYGWPRIVINDGTNARPAFRESQVILSESKPIRLLRDDMLGSNHWHNMGYPYPVFIDWDGDGRMDLIYSTAATGKIFLLRNVGTMTEPVFAAPRAFTCYGEPIGFTIHGPNAWAGDMNGDGKPDLLGCVEWSVYPFFCYAALEMPAHPAYRIGAVE